MDDFTLIDAADGYAAYQAQDNGAPSWRYMLTPSQEGAPGKLLSFHALWERSGPWALIVSSVPWDLSRHPLGQVAQALGLQQMRQNREVVLAWHASQDSAAAGSERTERAPQYQTITLGPVAPGQRQVQPAATLAFGNVTLTVPTGTAVTFNDTGPDGLRFVCAASAGEMTIGRTDTRVNSLGFSSASLAVPTDGPNAGGSLHVASRTLRAADIFLLGQDFDQVCDAAIYPPELRYWLQSGNSISPIRLPLFAPILRGKSSQPRLTVAIALNPALPFDARGTRFDVLGDADGCFLADAALLTRSGATVGLTPRQVSFHFAPGTVNSPPAVYLVPYGRFLLAAAVPASNSTALDLMPGLSGLERIEAQVGDVLDLIPGQAALGVVPQQAGSAPALHATCTTAWMTLSPAGSHRMPYFAQPLSSVFHASADGVALPRAADALLAHLGQPSPGQAPQPFPLAPYANVRKVPNPLGATIAAFEHTFLAGKRAAILGCGQAPVYSLNGAPLHITGATPRGLLADMGGATTAQATAPGQCRQLYLANSAKGTITLGPNPDGTVDPLLNNALMQPELFLVYSNWAYPIDMNGELDLGGFSVRANDPAVIMVVKWSRTASLRDLFQQEGSAHWCQPATFVGDDAAVLAARAAFLDALTEAKKGPAPLFDDFVQRIAGDPAWTGIVMFRAPIDGNNMPPTLQILVAGMQTPLRTHHMAIDISMLAADQGVPTGIGSSSVSAVIAYQATPDARISTPGDFDFSTRTLQVGIAGSVVTSFHAEVAITARKLFGRAVERTPLPAAPAAPDAVDLQGRYTVIAGVPTVQFALTQAEQFDFTVPGSQSKTPFYRVLQGFVLASASLLPQTAPPSAGAAAASTTHRAQITFDGMLCFAPDPFARGIDLFSYGQSGPSGLMPQGLGISNLALQMQFELDSNGVRTGRPQLKVDYSKLLATDNPAALRNGALMQGLPLKLTNILANEQGLALSALAGKQVQVLQLAAMQTQTPHFALQFDMIIGTLGELSGVHAGLTAQMCLAWGPLATTPDADGVLLTIGLPGASGGFEGFNLQGMLQLVFGDANLMQVKLAPPAAAPPGSVASGTVFALLFNNVALSVMGIKLPPKVVSDLVMFSNPGNAAGSNLAACLAVRES
ncbi:hypothetical protein Jab_2c14040 [Janthinobacterium sp. HH01]|uniref:hypothetical protein n=1 Tax=Janthinobacterium sp. HH01 TaxID=1198452 RepID=UPI0002AE8835|nr:hypothetical protein [Janthinobacterium sp. HH01]ELX09338.1 hypothetical protein Jab_2c14040 [Janthinobacterium sp. HH01]